MSLTRPLTPVEARVLGTLMEKARTVPDTYPLSLNLVLTGCNQKTSREPVMQLGEAQVQQALDDLCALGLALESHGARVPRYAHNAQRGLGVPDQAAALLGLLMLRGAQTAAELRLNAERWHRFADTSSVEGFLNELAERPPEKGGPLAQRLPRAPGSREHRWAHLLCGPVQAGAGAVTADAAADALEAGAAAALAQRVQALEAQVAALRATVARLCAELGMPPGDALGDGPGELTGESSGESEGGVNGG